MVDVRGPPWGMSRALNFSFHGRVCFVFKERASFPGDSRQREKLEGVRFVIEGRRPWGSWDLVYYELFRALAIKSCDPSIAESVNRDIRIPMYVEDLKILPRKFCTRRESFNVPRISMVNLSGIDIGFRWKCNMICFPQHFHILSHAGVCKGVRLRINN